MGVLFFISLVMTFPTRKLYTPGRVAQVGGVLSRYTRLQVWSPVRAHTRNNQWMHKEVEQQIDVFLFFSLSSSLCKKRPTTINTIFYSLKIFYTTCYHTFNIKKELSVTASLVVHCIAQLQEVPLRGASVDGPAGTVQCATVRGGPGGPGWPL